MHRVTRSAFAIGTVVGLGLLGYQAGRRAHVEPRVQAASDGPSAPAVPPPADVRRSSLPLPHSDESAAPEAAPGSSAKLEAPSISEDNYGLYASDVRNIFKETPALARFAYFQQHVLLDAQGKQRYHGLLADAGFFRGIRQDLRFPQELRASHKGQIRRLMGIDAIREALAWTDNPQRPSVLGLVEEILLADNIRPDLPLDLRQSLAANKLELFEILQSEEPARAAYVVERSRNTNQEALIDYVVEQVRLGHEYVAANGVKPPASTQSPR